MNTTENYIIVSDFAKALGISVQAVHKAMKEKRIKEVKRMGPIWLIHRSEIDIYKKNRT